MSSKKYYCNSLGQPKVGSFLMSSIKDDTCYCLEALAMNN